MLTKPKVKLHHTCTSRSIASTVSPQVGMAIEQLCSAKLLIDSAAECMKN